MGNTNITRTPSTNWRHSAWCHRQSKH